MAEKLDSFSKILLATGHINYMAASINGVNEQIKCSGLNKPPHDEYVKERDEVLATVVVKLTEVMEEMGNLING